MPATRAPRTQTVRFTWTAAERRVWRAREKVTVSQWAARHRQVEAGPMPGQWSNEMTPYLVKPMDAFNRPSVQKIILCFAPQTGKTQVAFNCLLYAIDQDPGPAMYVMPDEKTAKRISRRRIRPMFKSTPRVAGLLGPRADDVTTLAVTFQNGMDLMLTWSTSAAELASESVRYVFFDEIDKYPRFAGQEADPLSLGEVRTTTYPHTRKLVYLSTPTTEGGHIARAMENEADEVWRYQARCPFCRHLQVMEFDQIHWPERIRDPRAMMRKKYAKYGCVKCGMDWDDHSRNKAVRAGAWQRWSAPCWKNDARPVEMGRERPLAVGFHLPSWYSPFVSLSEVAAAFLRGLQDPSKMMVFVTQHKAEPWKEVIESKAESEILAHRCDIPPGVAPEEALALTAGIDVQKTGFWFVVRAWGADLTSWLVQYGFLSSWADVETLLFATRYPVQDNARRPMGIWRAAIDTGGGMADDGTWSRTEEIYHWLRANSRGLAFGVKGSSRPQLRRVQVKVIDRMARGNRPIPGGIELRMLDTYQFKGLLHWRLGRKKGESQRFYLHAETGMDYARQILAEELRKDRRGRLEWKQVRRDNHLLDAEIYAAACADPEWYPSLTLLAREMQAREQQMRRHPPEPPTARSAAHAGRRINFQRPEWLNR